MTWLWEVLQLLGFSTTVRLMMYNVWGGDVQRFGKRCTTIEWKMYDFYLMPLLSCNLHSAFSVSSASSLSEGDSGWRHCFTIPSLTYFERGQVVSVLSALTYGLNFVSPELNFIHRRAKVCSPPRWKLASCRLISDQSSEECVLIKRRVCLPWIQALFILNTGSVWGKCRFYFNCWQSLFIIHSESDSN